jgi:hypothetical protein
LSLCPSSFCASAGHAARMRDAIRIGKPDSFWDMGASSIGGND